MAQTTRMERGMAVLDLAAGTLQRGCLERIVADADRCAGAEEALRTTRVSLDMANTDRDELAKRVTELEAELETTIAAAISAEQEVTRLRAGLYKVNDVINAIIMADQSVQHSNGQKGLMIKHGQIRSILDVVAGVDHSPSDTND